MIELADPSRPVGAASTHVKVATLSQNETESLCLKAARGAGFSWGLAEEAGFAAGWLAARGFDGVTPFLTLLTEKLHMPGGSGAPQPMPGHWQSANQRPLCPITLGAALTDSALLADGPFSGETRLDPVAAPLLLLPFLARAAQICGKQVVINWPDGRLLITRNGAFDRQEAFRWIDQGALPMTITTAADLESLQNEPACLPAIPMTILNGLNALALRTTVPATDTSRRGAGSSTTDND
ncbi:MAG: DUF3726 domain-containing protein [Cypionkella sp.]